MNQHVQVVCLFVLELMSSLIQSIKRLYLIQSNRKCISDLTSSIQNLHVRSSKEVFGLLYRPISMVSERALILSQKS